MDLTFVGDAKTHPKLEEVLRSAEAQHNSYKERRTFIQQLTNVLRDDMEKGAVEYRAAIHAVMLEGGAITADIKPEQLIISKTEQVFIRPEYKDDCECPACTIKRMLTP